MSTRSNNELRKTLEHIFYEMMQFFGCVRLMNEMDDNAETDNDKMIMKNSLLESVLIHARALQDFFETSSSSKQPDDVVSEDYGFDCRRLGYSREIRRRINKEIAHITYTRNSRIDSSDWNLTELREPMKSLCNDFIGHVKTRWEIDSDPDVTVSAKNCLLHLKVEFERHSPDVGIVSTETSMLSFPGSVGIGTDVVHGDSVQKPLETNEESETDQ